MGLGIQPKGDSHLTPQFFTLYTPPEWTSRCVNKGPAHRCFHMRHEIASPSGGRSFSPYLTGEVYGPVCPRAEALPALEAVAGEPVLRPSAAPDLTVRLLDVDSTVTWSW